MPRIAVSSMFFHEYPLPAIFSMVARAGLDTMEFWPETPDFWVRGLPVGELRTLMAEYPGFLPVTVHAPVLDLNPCSINPQVAEISVSETEGAIRFAAGIGASVVTVHPGRRTAKRPPSDADFARFSRYIARIGAVSAETGVKVAIENMEAAVNSLLCTPGAVREVLDRYPWLSFTLDISHALGTAPGEAGKYIDLCGDRIVNVHCSLFRAGRNHHPVTGSRHVAAVLRHLSEYCYDGPLTLEIEDRTFFHPLSADEKVHVLARDGKFIREFFS